jgi:glycine/D-amino acid oxidase-like deaminating enzyme
VDPQMAVTHLIHQAKSRGAQFIYGARVHGYPWNVEGDVTGVCFTRKALNPKVEQLLADVVVLANGTGVARLAKAAGVRVALLHKPGVLAWLRPASDQVKPVELSKIIVGDGIHFLQRKDGLVVVGESKETGGASSVAYVTGHAGGVQGGAAGHMAAAIEVEQADGHVGEPEASNVGARMLAAAQRVIPALKDATVELVSVGHRPMPADGMPVVGFASSSCSTRSPRLYVAVCHSGVTLAPMLACMASLEIVRGVDVLDLSPYRPARFAPGGGGVG